MLTATLSNRPESTTEVFGAGENAKRAVFPLLRRGWLDVNGVVYEDGAFLANWYSLTLPPRVYIPDVPCEMTITWDDWGGLVVEAYREVELVRAA